MCWAPPASGVPSKGSKKFTGTESTDALLNNAQRCHRIYGYPSVTVDQMLEWTAEWIALGGATLNKPTHFEARDGKF